MSKKIIVSIISVFIVLMGCLIWYFNSVPSVESLKTNTLKSIDYTPLIGLSTGLEKDKTQSSWLSGICSPFQKSTQSIFVSTQKDFEIPFVTIFLLNKNSLKVEKSIAFVASKPYPDTLSYIKSNCLADIFSNREKYKEIYRNNDSSQLSEIDYAVEFAKYTFQQEQKAKVKELCGTPDLVEYLYANNFTFPYKVTKDQLRLCVNAKNGEDPNKPLENTFGNIELVKEVIQKSQLLP
jgi:hypothetical protein